MARTARIRAGSIIAAAASLLALAPWPVATAQERPAARTGSVTGRVLETDGTEIPGVFVVIEGPSPGHAQRRTRADSDARFEFDNLVPGTYRLAIELPGLAAPGDVEVVVTAGETVQANAILSLFAYEAEVEVVGRAPQDAEVFDSDSTSGAVTLEGPLLSDLPLPAEQVLEALPLLPGIVRGPSGLVSIGGSLPTDSAFLFNGADLIDPFTGRYRMQIPLEAVDNVQLYRGAYAASYGDSTGGVVDVATAGAGDQWETEVASLVPRPWFSGGGLRGVKRFSPRLRFGGPVVPGNLYFSQSIGYQLDRETVRDVPQERGDHLRFEGWQSLTQVDWRPPGAHRLSLMLLAFPETESHVGLSALTPIEATSEIQRGAAALLAEHTFRVDPQGALTTAIQLNEVSVVARPESFSPVPWQVTPDGHDGTAFHFEDRATRHWQLRTAYSRVFGGPQPRHLIEVGIDMHGISSTGNTDNGVVEVRGAAGDLLRRIEFVGDGDLRGSKREIAFFGQERFRPSDRVWFDAGVRVSYDGVAGGWRAAPRAAVAWDVFGETRTLLKISSGLLYRRVFLGEFLWEQQQTRVETNYSGDGMATTRVLRPTVAGDLDASRAWLATAEVSHRFSDSLTLLARYTRRETRDRLVFDVDPGSSVTHAAEADPLTIAAALPEAQRGGLVLANRGESSYQEAELTTVWRSPRGHQLFLSYVRSRALGDLNDPGQVTAEEPAAILRPNAYGRLPFDAPDRVVLWGRIYLPWDLTVAPVLEWRSGFPWSAVAEDQSYFEEPASRRFPAYVVASLSMTKGVRLAGRPLRMGLQVRNLTNRSNPQDVIANSASARFGQFFNSRGIQVRFRSSITF